MPREIIVRLVRLPIVLWAAATLTFLVLHIIPGDAASMIASQGTTPQQLALVRHDWGLDQPLVTQYLHFLGQLAHGDLGTSFASGTPTISLLAQRVPATAEIAVFALLISTVLGVTAGIVAAVNRGRWPDYLARLLSVTMFSIPWFWLALMLIAIFSVKLGWTPVAGRQDLRIEETPITNFLILDSILTRNWPALGDALRHLILPSLALGLASAGFVARITRASMLETLRQEYIRTARSKGLQERLVILRHAFRPALIPVITLLGLQFGGLLGGAVIVETVFAWPGVGSLLLQSIYQRDYAVVQAAVIFIAGIYVIVNTLTDALYAYIDPRLRQS